MPRRKRHWGAQSQSVSGFVKEIFYACRVLSNSDSRVRGMRAQVQVPRFVSPISQPRSMRSIITLPYTQKISFYVFLTFHCFPLWASALPVLASAGTVARYVDFRFSSSLR